MLLVPRFETCYQIALAIKEEVEDLEKAGINVIQIDEAALREGLPLRKSEEAFYLEWAVHSFRITNCGVQDTCQVLPPTFDLMFTLKFFLFSCNQLSRISRHHLNTAIRNVLNIVFVPLTVDPHPHVLFQLQRYYPLHH